MSACSACVEVSFGILLRVFPLVSFSLERVERLLLLISHAGSSI